SDRRRLGLVRLTPAHCCVIKLSGEVIAVRIPRSLAFALLAALDGSLGYSQVTSRVSGTIRDATDAVMQGVTVTLEETRQGTTQATVSNEAGRYAFPSVKVGSYRVSAESAGFKKATTETFPVDVNQTVEMDFRMEVGQ